MQIVDDPINNDYDERISLELDDLENIDCEPSTVRVEFEVEELETTQVQVPFTSVNFPAETPFFIADTAIQVSIKSLEPQIDSLEYAFEVLVDYNLVDWEDSTVLPNVKVYSDEVFKVIVDSGPVKLQQGAN